MLLLQEREREREISPFSSDFASSQFEQSIEISPNRGEGRNGAQSINVDAISPKTHAKSVDAEEYNRIE